MAPSAAANTGGLRQLLNQARLAIAVIPVAAGHGIIFARASHRVIGIALPIAVVYVVSAIASETGAATIAYPQAVVSVIAPSTVFDTSGLRQLLNNIRLAVTGIPVAACLIVVVAGTGYRVIVVASWLVHRAELRAAVSSYPHHAFSLAPGAAGYTGCTVVELFMQLHTTGETGVALAVFTVVALAGDRTAVGCVVIARIWVHAEACPAAFVDPDRARTLAPALAFNTGRRGNALG